MLRWDLLQLILAAIVMVINQKFFISGFKGIIAPCTQYGYACCTWFGRSHLFTASIALFMMTDAQVHGDDSAACYVVYARVLF